MTAAAIGDILGHLLFVAFGTGFIVLAGLVTEGLLRRPLWMIARDGLRWVILKVWRAALLFDRVFDWIVQRPPRRRFFHRR